MSIKAESHRMACWMPIMKIDPSFPIRSATSFAHPASAVLPQSAEPGRMRIVPWKQRLFTGAAGTQEVPVAGTMMS